MDQRILPEVRPFVTNMPEETYRIQSSGAARSRDLPTVNNQVNVTGVPRMTHNATAIASISCDFKQSRGAATTIHADWGPVEMKADDVTDTDDIEDEVSVFDRAIEKGIGRVKLLPENCHHEISEPTRAIAEIRTIVTAQDQLNSLTYIEERGGWVAPRTDTRQASADFCDVHLDFTGAGDLGGFGVASTREVSCFLTNGDLSARPHVRYNVHEAPNGTFATLADGSEWDGRVRFEWDGRTRQYVSRAFTVTFKFLRRLNLVDEDPGNDVLAGAVTTNVVVRFESYRTSVAKDGYCLEKLSRGTAAS